MRAGAHALSLLAAPLNVEVLTALAEKPKSLMDLRRAAGTPPQTTMRGHLKVLTEIGVLERRRQNSFPGNVDFELGRPGQDLLGVAAVLEGWLARAPEGPLNLGSIAAKSSIKAMSDGWSSTIVRALAARPLSLTELNRLILDINYPSLERRLGAMRLAGLIEPRPAERRGTPYAAAEWLRRAVAPLSASARWERQYVPQRSAPITAIDAEAAFLLTIPMMCLSPEHTGACRMVVEMRSPGEQRLAGVMVGVKEGRVASCVSRLQGKADGWVSGSPRAWISAVVEQDIDQLEVGGDCSLALALLDALHGALSRSVQGPPPSDTQLVPKA